MPPYIKGDETAALVARLAELSGLSKQGAVKPAVQAALDQATRHESVGHRLRKLWAENPLPSGIGKRAKKTLFDELSGDL